MELELKYQDSEIVLESELSSEQVKSQNRNWKREIRLRSLGPELVLMF